MAGSKLGEAYVDIRGDLAPLKAAFLKAKNIAVTGAVAIGGAFVKNLGKAFKASVRIATDAAKKIYRAFKWALGKAYHYAKRFTQALVAIGVAGVYAFAKFEAEMANVSTMLNKQSQRLLPEMARAVEHMAVKFGEGTKTLSKGLYDILSAGIPASKSLDVLAQSAMAARAGVATTAEAANLLATVMNAYSVSADKAEQVSDILFTTVKGGMTTFAELAASMGQSISTAAAAGVTFQEFSGFLAMMTNAGIKTADAVTALNAMLIAFLKPSEKGARIAKEFGFELDTDTIRAIGLVGAMKKLTDATQKQVAAIFPEIRGMKGVFAALKDVAGTETAVSNMFRATGATMEAFAKQTKTTKYSMDQFREATILVFRKIGETLVGAWGQVKDSFVASLEALSKQLGLSSQSFQKWLDDTEPMSKKFAEVFKTILDGFIGFTAWLQVIYKNWEKITASGKEELKGIWKGVRDSFEPQIEFLRNLWTDFWGWLSGPAKDMAAAGARLAVNAIRAAFEDSFTALGQVLKRQFERLYHMLAIEFWEAMTGEVGTKILPFVRRHQARLNEMVTEDKDAFQARMAEEAGLRASARAGGWGRYRRGAERGRAARGAGVQARQKAERLQDKGRVLGRDLAMQQRALVEEIQRAQAKARRDSARRERNRQMRERLDLEGPPGPAIGGAEAADPMQVLLDKTMAAVSATVGMQGQPGWRGAQAMLNRTLRELPVSIRDQAEAHKRALYRGGEGGLGEGVGLQEVIKLLRSIDESSKQTQLSVSD